MLRRLEKSHDHVIGYTLADDVSEQEYEQLASELRDEIARHGGIRLLYRLTDLSPSSFFTALDERVRFAREHADDIDRVAVVTDDTATELLSRLGDVFSGIEVQTFSTEDEPKAWAWIE
jgi:hypothetical protein